MAASDITGRAYAVLTVKALADDRRVITGVATTPETDRVGDIIEPLGVTFTNPLPLLLYHDTTKPVGTVTFKPATKRGIEFEAHLPEVTDPGPLRDRVNEAWASIKARLLTGVSIGFRTLNGAVEVLKTGGLRFLETEVLELSLVAVPANASARIEGWKALDVASWSATGPAPVTSTLARVAAAPVRLTTMAQNASDFITAYQGERTAKAGKMADLMAKAAAAGVTLDDAQNQEYDRLTEEVKRLDEHLARARELEAVEKAAAQPVRATTQAEASATRSGQPVSVQVRDTTPPGMDFIRSIICRGAAFLSGRSAAEIAAERYAHAPRVAQAFKAAVAAGTTTDATWAGPLVDPTNLASEFIEWLRPQTIIGRIQGLRRVPFNVRIIGQTSGASAAWVGQGSLKPVTKFDVEATTLTWAKIAAIAVISDELFRFSSPSAEALVRDELARALIERMDTDFIDPSKAVAANVSPASITNGLVAYTPSGTSATHVRTDVATLMSAFLAVNQNPTGAAWIMPNTTALSLSLMVNALGQPEFPGLTMNGGTFSGLPVVTSQYAAVGSPTSNLVILANAPEIFLSDDGGVSVDVSREASIEMSSDPNNESGTVVSMFQSNQVAIRAERYVNWAKRRTGAVVYMDDVAWA